MELDPRLHFVAITGIIVRKRESGEFEFLIARRAPHEKAYPGRWTVPGGKLVLSEYKDLPKTTKDAWYNIVEWVLRKEIQEEVGLEIEKPQHLTDMTFVRPDGYPVLVLSYWCWLKNGDVHPHTKGAAMRAQDTNTASSGVVVKLCKDLTDFAWATVEEAKNHDLIEGIWEEIRDVERLLTS